MLELIYVGALGGAVIYALNAVRPETAKERVSAQDRMERLWKVAMKAMQDKKFIPAEKALLTILKLDHKNAAAYNRLGILYAKQQNYNDAVECFEIASSLEPKASSLHNVGLIYMEIDKYEKAADSFNRALELEPMAARYIALAKVRHKQGKAKQVIEALKQAAELEPNQQTYRLLIEAYKANGQEDKAAETEAELKNKVMPKGGSKKVKQPKTVE